MWVDLSYSLPTALTGAVVSLRSCRVLRKLKLVFETSPHLYGFIRDTLKTLESGSLYSLTLKCLVISQEFHLTLRDDWDGIDTILSERKVFIGLEHLYVSISSLCDQEIEHLLRRTQLLGTITTRRVT